jgi:hypothetical protein
VVAFRLEFDETIGEHHCSCCTRSIRFGRGFVFEGAAASGLYWFDLHERDGDRRLRMLVTLDAHAKSSTFEPGVSFVVQGWLDEHGLNFSLRDPADSPVVVRRDITGRTLSRKRALRHQDLARLWAMVDEIVAHDPELARFVHP